MIPAGFFASGCKLPEADIKHGLEKIAHIYRSVDEVDINRLN